MIFFVFLMRRRPPRSTRTDTLFPYPTLFRSHQDTIISTNVRTRLDGLPRSGEREPNDSGAAVYWEEWNGERRVIAIRSEEHTSELQSLMRISYAVFCLKKKKK